MSTFNKKIFGFAAVVFGILVSATAIAHTDGIYNPTANSVGDTQGIDSNGGVIASSLPLDGLTTGLISAYSTRKLRTAYAGSAIRAQRLSDNAQQDIGFATNVLDTASLATFCSGTTCRVMTWYDQNGGTDVTQATFINAPIIYTAGAVNVLNSKPALSFNGHFLANATTSNPVSTLFQNAVVTATLVPAGATIVGPSVSGGLEWRVNNTGKLEMLKGGVASVAQSTGALTANTGAIVESQYDGTTWSFWINRSASGTGSSAQTLTAATLRIGDSGALGEQFTGSIGELLRYDQVGSISAGTRTSIENNQSTYWGTP